ncbi:hypothetical protein CHS0354_007785 [Potamilus streckersoni]|uniref:Uncharacterized protein n=1 Tax=Potamilus streckersoni TaxID=2493646 RepID=A0AAE0TFR0_9BIVA|nr:hypothetical protein CHS0354_007785 [Potamilus streckersoni]
MSYGSLYFQSEHSNQTASKIARMKQEYEKRLVHYERGFDVNLSRIENRDRNLRESMLAYTERMRSITDSRRDGIQSDPLFVRAKHIPRYPQKGYRRRRPMSLDELIGRDKDQRPQAAKLERRPLSERDVKTEEEKIKSTDTLSQPVAALLPALPERLKNTGSSVQVSFVSASDLYDIVDFSLKSKGTRQDSIQILRMEREAALAAEHSENTVSSSSKFVNTSPRTDDGDKKTMALSLQPIDITGKGIDGKTGDQKIDNEKEENKSSTNSGGETDENEDESDDSGDEIYHIRNKESFGKINILRLRPKRAKRMKLQTPNLGAIPEDEVLSGNKTSQDLKGKRMVSPPPPKQSARSISSRRPSILSIIPENEASFLSDSRPLRSQRNEYRTIPPLLDYMSGKSTRRILMKDDGDVRIEVTQCPPKQDFLSLKMKAQKRFKKLIYLRDVPDRHSQLPRV